MKNKKLVIFGTLDYAQLAHEYFTHDSEYEVAAFTVDGAYISARRYMGKPVVPFETLEAQYPPTEYEVHVAVVYGELNRIRQRKAVEAKAKGFDLASYVSSRAFVWPNVRLGEHCFIFEDNTIQPFVTIGDNTVLWSGNHIGHHSTIGSNCFVTSHVVVSGFCEIGDNCFLGVNSTIGNHVSIGSDSWICQGASVTRSVEGNSFVKGPETEVAPLDEERLFGRLQSISRERGA